jgi:hypothetical protein
MAARTESPSRDLDGEGEQRTKRQRRRRARTSKETPPRGPGDPPKETEENEKLGWIGISGERRTRIEEGEKD